MAIWEMNGTNVIGGGSDILLQSTSGEAAMWDMSGTTITGGGVVSTNPGPSWRAVQLT
jgi:hypothetical protein